MNSNHNMHVNASIHINKISLRCVHFTDNHILSIQSNEVGGSYHMEKEGLHRVMEFLQGENLTVGVLVTDRHRQINK